jgi:hypothetical protein
VRVTRRELVGAAGALGAAGLYELVDRIVGAPPRAAAASARPEQHLLDGQQVVEDDGIEIVVPPLHHQVVTARVAVAERRRDLRSVQRELERALAGLERRFEPSPRGLGVTVAWGLPYFRRYVAGPAADHVPVDLRASRAKSRRVPALLDAIRFPSDPAETALEANDVAVLLRSDSQSNVAAGARALFDDLRGLWHVTSVRKGFAGGGFGGKRSLPKRMALAAGVPGAELIPETAELFLGFTSTQRAGLGPGRIANLETLGYTDAGGRYFHGGTHMHLSHLFEDLEAWYLNFDFDERVSTSFRPGLRVRDGAQTVRQAPQDVAHSGAVKRTFARTGAIGHSSAIQTSSRLDRDVVGRDGVLYRRGTAVPQRADFNTLDNPFFWSVEPARDGMGEGAAAGVHFVVFNPSSDDFHRNRLAMDGVLPDGTRLALEPRTRGQGFNAILRTTHRQNFLVPPRRHRSFPLVELLR